jgi:hypothetical protein
MYETDMPRLREHGLASPEGFADVVTFVLLTIKQPFPQMQKQFADVRRHKARSKFLFGAKREGYRYVRENRQWLYDNVTKAARAGDCVAAIDMLTNVPGLGIVKAAFVAQCLGFNAACLDSHNLARFGLDYQTVRLSKKVKPELRLAKIRKYLALAHDIGDAAYWWNSWCEYVAGLYDALPSAEAVSAFHTRALGLS